MEGVGLGPLSTETRTHADAAGVARHFGCSRGREKQEGR